MRGEQVKMTGQRYFLHFALPNFFFHATTAYDILRNAGVEVGKRDFMGKFLIEPITLAVHFAGRLAIRAAASGAPSFWACVYQRKATLAIADDGLGAIRLQPRRIISGAQQHCSFGAAGFGRARQEQARRGDIAGGQGCLAQCQFARLLVGQDGASRCGRSRLGNGWGRSSGRCRDRRDDGRR